MDLRPASRVEWLHRELKLEIGKTYFVFRTLSFYDCWVLWPHLTAIVDAVTTGYKPLQFAEHLLPVLRILNPVLAGDDESKKAMTSVHVDALLEFYGREHRWTAIQELGDQTTAKPGMNDADARSAEQGFVIVCAAAARFVGMPALDFMQQRFEFCCDAVQALRLANETAERGDRVQMQDLVPILEQYFPKERVDPANKPPWMVDIESRTN